MKIELHEIPIREIVKGYVDSAENGVVAYGGRLNVRPAFQREFIYKDKQRDEVINTVRHNFPLNVMYWVKSDDGNFEVLDGQQRTISICQYYQGDFSINHQGFGNLTKSEQDQILDYPLMIYLCEGTDKEKLDWFKIINIAGEQLTPQELRNAIYTGEWLTEAKKYFSRSGCPAYGIASEYLSGTAIRQDYLQTAIKWISHRDGIEIEDYMAAHQHDTNCNEIWLYFQSVINWVKVTFPHYRKEMKGLPWGEIYNEFGKKALDTAALEAKVAALNKEYQDILMPPKPPKNADGSRPEPPKNGDKAMPKKPDSKHMAKRQEYEKKLKQILTDEQYKNYQKMQPPHGKRPGKKE